MAPIALLVLNGCSASGDPGRPGGGYDDPGMGGSFGSGGSGTATGGWGGSGFGGSGGSLPAAGGTSGSGGAGVGGTSGVGGSSGAGPGTGGSSSVTFEWPETTPGTGKCKAGHYQGDFVGIYSPAIIVFPAPIPVTGNVDLTLAESPDGEFFEISGGKVSGLANGLFPYSADVVGTLDCKARKLVNASLKNGKYTVGITDYPFEGPISADYDTLTYAFVNGTWDVKEPNPIYGGSGTWNGRNVP